MTAIGKAAAITGERLQKALAQLGLGSRREVEAWIRAGRLTVNGQPASLGMRVTPKDHVRLDGRLVQQRPAAAARVKSQVQLCHRSPGVDLAEITRALPRRAGRRFIAVSPMPRVDGGLELVTADGAAALTLQRGVRQLECEFSVRVHGELSPALLARVQEGVLDSGAQVAVLSLTAAGGEGSNRWYTLVARGASGKEVRQLFERVGVLVSRVLRTRLGGVTLDRALPRGRSRVLTEEESTALLAAAQAEGADAAAEQAQQRHPTE
ncbi:MAG TPA: S4 domain-containing protein [Steroidobacteraceae bacterium]|nr:S4 domain-containing protein [Steroidobacteraceae bacterium]